MYVTLFIVLTATDENEALHAGHRRCEPDNMQEVQPTDHVREFQAGTGGMWSVGQNVLARPFEYWYLDISSNNPRCFTFVPGRCQTKPGDIHRGKGKYLM